MATAPTALVLSAFMLGSAAATMLLILFMHWLVLAFFEGDERKLGKYLG